MKPPAEPAPVSVRDWLRHALRLGLPRSEARQLLSHVLRREASWLLAHDEDPVEPGDARRFEHLAQQRLDAVPMAYLLGAREFHGLMLAVDSRVLDPRPDTETLVDWALEWLARPQAPTRPRVLDLGTGSGAIALALAHACPHARVTAVDRSPEALAVARANGERLGLAVHWCLGDWFSGWQPPDLEPVPSGATGGERFDLIVSNPPYLADADPHLPALRHEPRGALVSGPDGLEDLRRLACEAPGHLLPGGALMLEHGYDQGPSVQSLLAAAGGHPLGERRDLAGHWRCTGAHWD